MLICFKGNVFKVESLTSKTVLTIKVDDMSMTQRNKYALPSNRILFVAHGNERYHILITVITNR